MFFYDFIAEGRPKLPHYLLSNLLLLLFLKYFLYIVGWERSTRWIDVMMTKNEVAGFFKKYGASVYRLASLLLGSREDAEEATQEVFIRVLSHANTFEHREDCSIYPWLVRITTNYCLNMIRDSLRRSELVKLRLPVRSVLSPGGFCPEKMVLIRKLLADADESLALVAIYRIVYGMSADEVARLLGVTRRTVINRFGRFRKWAVAYLESCSEKELRNNRGQIASKLFRLS